MIFLHFLAFLQIIRVIHTCVLSTILAARLMKQITFRRCALVQCPKIPRSIVRSGYHWQDSDGAGHFVWNMSLRGEAPWFHPLIVSHFAWDQIILKMSLPNGGGPGGPCRFQTPSGIWPFFDRLVSVVQNFLYVLGTCVLVIIVTGSYANAETRDESDMANANALSSARKEIFRWHKFPFWNWASLESRPHP